MTSLIEKKEDISVKMGTIKGKVERTMTAQSYDFYLVSLIKLDGNEYIMMESGKRYPSEDEEYKLMKIFHSVVDLSNALQKESADYILRPIGAISEKDILDINTNNVNEAQIVLYNPGKRFGFLDEYVTFFTKTKAENIYLTSNLLVKLIAKLHSVGFCATTFSEHSFFVTDSGIPLLSDFTDLGKTGTHINVLDTGYTYNPSTNPTRNMAPERFFVQYRFTKSDVWSLAILLAKLYTGKRPYLGLDFYEIIKAIKIGVLPYSEDDFASQSIIWKTLAKCWESDSEYRPTAAELYSTINTDKFRDAVYICVAANQKLRVKENEDKNKPVTKASTTQSISLLPLKL